MAAKYGAPVYSRHPPTTATFPVAPDQKNRQQPKYTYFAPNLVHVAGMVQAIQTLKMYQFHFQKLKQTPRKHIFSSRYEPIFLGFLILGQVVVT